MFAAIHDRKMGMLSVVANCFMDVPLAASTDWIAICSLHARLGVSVSRVALQLFWVHRQRRFVHFRIHRLQLLGASATMQESFYSIMPHGLRDRLAVEGWSVPDSKSAKLVRDAEVAGSVLELSGSTGATCVSFPESSLNFIGTTLPVLNLQLKNVVP